VPESELLFATLLPIALTSLIDKPYSLLIFITFSIFDFHVYIAIFPVSIAAVLGIKYVKGSMLSVFHIKAREPITTNVNSMEVQTGDGVLSLLEVQLEGKKRMQIDAFLRGYKVEVGDVFSL